LPAARRPRRWTRRKRLGGLARRRAMRGGRPWARERAREGECGESGGGSTGRDHRGDCGWVNRVGICRGDVWRVWVGPQGSVRSRRACPCRSVWGRRGTPAEPGDAREESFRSVAASRRYKRCRNVGSLERKQTAPFYAVSRLNLREAMCNPIIPSMSYF
jgi:hypothetical protein